MVKILCFGDSNTWGAIPGEMRRYNIMQRWPTILKNYLPVGCELIEEGQAGRTAAHNDPKEQERNALSYLPTCLDKHRPDVVLILLGTNDLKKRFKLSAEDISDGVTLIAETVLKFEGEAKEKKPSVLLIAPPPIDEVGCFSRMFAGGAEKSRHLANLYARSADTLGCAFFDAGKVVKPCNKEGIHWPADQHQLFADALAPEVHKLLIDEQLITTELKG